MQPRELLSFIVCSMVRKPEAVEVKEASDERNRVIKLKVDESDLGRVIGKEGRTAKALRTVLAVATAQDEQKAKLDIVD
ncbi:MAG: KH domain-containing protein [Deltaproteobacteria bacterium]|nr:KH domain-containing protein [Deltaproteobacteria bacterium]